MDLADTSKRSRSISHQPHEPLAIVGVSFRFPGAADLAEYWQMLIEGKDCISQPPPDRWNADTIYDASGLRPNSTVSPLGGFLGDVWRFDTNHFGINEEEAHYLDPQQRLLLMLTEEILDEAREESASDRIGVFVGAGGNDNFELVISQMASGRLLHPTTAVGCIPSMQAARLAHHFRLTGPAMVIDTACSSALVALHEASLSLRTGECDLALVGSAQLSLTATTNIALSRAGALSPTGRCRPFDATADGTVLSEGAAVLLLTRLEDALQQERRFYGIVRGSAINNNGRTLTPMAPGLRGQRDVIEKAVAASGVDASQISYIEAHGTSTVIGDAVETRALSQALPPHQSGTRYLGSVKSNLGHMLGAAALPGLVKVLLAMRQGVLPPSIHCDEPNPRLGLSRAGLRVVNEQTSWEVDGPRIAGVSSFGFGGTNAHVILEQPPAELAAPIVRRAAKSAPQTAYRLDPGPDWASTRLGADRQSPSLTVRSWSEMVYLPDWRHHSSTASKASPPLPSRWYLAGDNPALAEAVVEIMRCDGLTCSIVTSASELSRMRRAESQYSAEWGLIWISPAREAELSTAEPDAQSEVDEATGRVLDLQEFLQTATRKDGASESNRAMAVLMVTHDAWSPIASDSVRATSTALAGYASAVADERPCPWIRTLDLPSASDLATRAHAVVAELKRSNAEPFTALQDDHHWHPTLAGLDVSRTPTEERDSKLDSHGCCLFVGGAGGIGTSLTTVLSERFENIVLVGRRPLDTERQELLSKLRNPDRTIDYNVCDITNENDCARLVADCVARFGQIRGLVHAAGDVAFGLIGHASEQQTRTILSAKISGTHNLHCALQQAEQHPDLLLLFSSLSAQLPSLGGGLAPYVAANAWMNAFAAERRAEGWPYRVISWGNFADAGMGAHPALVDRLKREGIGSLSTSDGQALFRFALRCDEPHLVLADVKDHLQTTRQASTETTVRELDQRLATSADGTSTSNASQKVSARSTGIPRSVDGPIEARLVRQVAERLGVDEQTIDIDQHLAELGLDSLAAVDLVTSLSESSDTPLPVSLFFEYPTIRELGKYLVESGIENDGTHDPSKTSPPKTDRVQTHDVPLTKVQNSFARSAFLYPQLPCFASLRQELTEPLDLDSARRALRCVVARHELLRSKLPTPLATRPADHLVIAEQAIPEVRILTTKRTAAAEENDICNTPWSLSESSLLRIVLLRETNTAANIPSHQEHLLFVAHHMIADGWSMRNFFEEFWLAYAAYKHGTNPKLPTLRTSFSDYATATSCATPSADLAWWNEYLELESENTLTLEAETAPAGRFGIVSRKITAEDTAALTARTEMLGTSVFAWLLAISARCVGLWANRRRVPLRIAHAGRTPRLPGIARTIGCFADTVPLVVETKGLIDQSAKTAQAQWQQACEHLSVSSAELLDATNSDLLRTPFGFSYVPLRWKLPGSVGARDGSIRTGTSAIGLNLNVWRFEDELRLSFSFADWQFDLETVERFADGWLKIFAASLQGEVAPDYDFGSWPPSRPRPIISKPSHDRPTSISAAAKNRNHDRAHSLLTKFNSGTQIEPAPWTLHERFAMMAKDHPKRTALRFGEQSYTYSKMNDLADSFARHLLSLKIKPESTVALCSPRSAELFVALLGIIKAGCAYLYFSPETPADRKRALLDDACVPVVVTTTELSSGFSPHTVVCLDSSEWRESENEARLPDVQTDQPAYICYTSGSTGKPKGVVVPHRAATRLTSLSEGVHFTPKDIFLQNSTLAFDASVLEMFSCWMNGATLAVAPPGPLTLAQLAETIQQHGVTVAWLTAGLFSQMVEYELNSLGQLRVLCVGGDVVSVLHARRLKERWPHVCLMNGYGPTETNFTTTHLVQDEDLKASSIPIGRPLQGTQLVVLDPQGLPVDVGEVGELYVAGQSLAHGYLNQPEQTAERFVHNPFEELPGERLYRTGDLVRWREDGVLLFVGRVDRQVKIRGHRVEPDEVEHALRSLPGVRDAAVVVHYNDHREAKQLVAFIQPRNSQPPSDVLQLLALSLPEYMIPSRLEVLEEWPLNSSGKIDRGQLADLVHSKSAGQSPTDQEGKGSPPRSPLVGETQRRVAAAFSKVLNRQVQQPDADFFHLGGDSLGVLQLFAELGKEWTSLPSPQKLYEARTVAALAALIDTRQGNDSNDRLSEPSEPCARFPLSASQAGFVLMRQAAPTCPDTWSATLEIEGELHLDRFRLAMQRVIEHQPMLRTFFPKSFRGQQQISKAGQTPPVAFEDLLTISADQQAERIEQCQQTARNVIFDLEKLPLFQLTLLRLNERRHVGVLGAHHLIGDALSVHVLARDLADCYAGLASDPEYRPVPLEATFRDAVTAQLGSAEEEPTRVAYWRQVFATPYAPPLLCCNESDEDHGGYTVQHLSLGAPETEALRGVAKECDVSLFAIILDRLAHELARETQQEDLVIGVAHAGRDPRIPDCMRIFGCFASSVPVRLNLMGQTPATSIHRTAKAVSGALRNALDPRTLARTCAGGLDPRIAVGSQFFVTFMDFGNLSDARQNNQDSGLKIRLAPESTHQPLAANLVDLQVEGRIDDGALTFTIQGSSRAFGADGVEKLADAFKLSLCSIAQDIRTETGSDEQCSLDVAIDQSTAVRVPAPAIGIATQASKSEENASPADPNNVDAALVGYLPSIAQISHAMPELQSTGLPLTPDAIREFLFKDQPCALLEQVETPWGTSAFVSIRRFADELDQLDRTRLLEEAQAGIDYACRLGAKAISLAGMLPALTSYGHDLAIPEESRTQGVVLTTGHACTVVSVSRQALSCLERTGREWQDETVAVLGLGSIGLSTLKLLLEEAGQPGELILCDRPMQRTRIWSEIAACRELLDDVSVRIACADEPPDSVLLASLIIGATSTPGILDVDALRPGTIVVDDSFPHCVDEQRAIRRMQQEGDVIITGGGMLSCGTIKRSLSPSLPQVARTHIANALPSFGLPSCQLESLILSCFPSFKPTIGLVDITNAQNLAAVLPDNVCAAPCHLGSFLVPDTCLERSRLHR